MAGELVEVLQQFIRGSERSVSAEFWHRNLEVLKATAALTTSMRQALELLAGTAGSSRAPAG